MKGKTNNPAGRPRGTPNKITAELRSRIAFFLEGNWTRFEADYSSLEPFQRAQLFERLLPFVLPKLKEQDLNIQLQNLSDADLDMIIDKIFQDENQD